MALRNLTRQQIPERLSGVKPFAGAFVATAILGEAARSRQC